MKDLSRSVGLLCKVCGNDMFEVLDNTDDMLSAPGTIKVRFADCKKIYTKQELIDENEEVINSNIEEIKEEAIEEIEKELKKSFKKIRIKL